jgi:hypothetical protein
MKKDILHNNRMAKMCWAILLFFHCFAHSAIAQYTGTVPVTLTIPSTATAVVWYKDGAAISGATATTYAASTVGNYYATYTDGTTTCTTDRSLTFVLAKAGTNVALMGATNNGTGTNYLWYNGSTSIAAATTSNYTANTGGKYHLEYNNGSCVVKSADYLVFMLACSAGTTAPTLSAATAVNTCPTTTANLNALHNGTIPNGARLRWHTVATNPTAADSVATPSVLAASGTYYAYYYDQVNDCYSPASAAVTATITVCSTCATPSVGGTATYTGGTICSTANMGTITLSGKTGTVQTWQTSTNGGTSWTDIAATANKVSYTFINAANAQQYRAVVNSGAGCVDAFSAPATITTSATACTTTTCSYTSGTFNPTITTSTNPTYTTHLILVNPTSGVMEYVSAANATAFTGVAQGDYVMYAVTFDNTLLPTPTLTAGTNISALTTGCFSVSNPLITKVCINNPPVITSGGSATTPENVLTTTPVYTATATDPNSGQTLTFSLETGGVDNAKFNIDPLTGVVTFVASPDFELPTDADGNNIYLIKIKVCDNGNPILCTTKDVAITVTNVIECLASTNAPTLSATTLANVCPTTTVDLNSLVTSTTPNGARLRWHTVATNPTAADSVATPSVLTASGTYYAYYFDAISNCYSPVSAAVTVTMKASCTDTDGDGIIDLVDIDDDNDGVLDLDENACSMPTLSTTLLNVTFETATAGTLLPKGNISNIAGTGGLTGAYNSSEVVLNGGTNDANALYPGAFKSISGAATKDGITTIVIDANGGDLTNKQAMSSFALVNNVNLFDGRKYKVEADFSHSIEFDPSTGFSNEYGIAIGAANQDPIWKEDVAGAYDGVFTYGFGGITLKRYPNVTGPAYSPSVGNAAGWYRQSTTYYVAKNASNVQTLYVQNTTAQYTGGVLGAAVVGSVVDLGAATDYPWLNNATLYASPDEYVDNIVVKALECDADGDGIANRLDTDSDGDGCSDAFEAGATTSLTPNYQFPTASVGTNGLSSSVENNDTQAATTIYTSTYSTNALNNAIKNCTDSDNDGIADIYDLDDDNDGILDTQECGICTTDLFSNGGFELPNITLAPYSSTTYKVVDQTSVSGWQTTAPDGKIEYWRSGFQSTPSAEGNQFVELNANYSSTLYQTFCLNGASGTINWSVKHRGRSGTDVATLKIGTTLATAAVVQTMSDGNSAWGVYSGTYTIPAGQTNLIIAFESVSSFGGVLTTGNFLDDVQITVNQGCPDTDGDGIVNSLDLDSDGDGCSDALEAGATTSKVTNFQFPAASVGTNGLSSSVENNDSQTATTTYTSTYAQFALVKTSNACIDTDGDGISDVVDEDDDNDGITDLVENACGTALNTVEFNGTFGSVTTVRDLQTPITGVYYYGGTGGGSLNPSGAYVVTSYATCNPIHTATDLWDNLYGHTTGTSDDGYLAVNGSASAGVFYTQNMTLNPNQNYNVSLWAIHGIISPTYSGGPADIEIRVTRTSDNAVVATYTSGDIRPTVLPTGSNVTPAYWKQVQGNFNTGAATAFKLEVISIKLSSDGNDFAIDDVAIKQLDCANAGVDTDGDGIANSLDLDSDNDGCSDANENYSSPTADGGGGQYGTGADPVAVNAQGKVLAAPYTGSYANNTVATKTAIATQPIDKPTTVGGTTTFTVVGTAINTTTFAAGVPNYTIPPATNTNANLVYQWQQSTDNGTTWTNITNGGIYSGATSATLTLTGATAAMNGYDYKVIVTHTTLTCPLMSTAANLCVGPVVTATVTQPTCTLATGTITVSAPANGATVTYTVTGTSPVVAAQTNATGVFSGLASGVYSVIATDGCASAPVSLTINAQPATPVISNVAKTDPSVLSCPALDNGTLTVNATGSNLAYSIDGGVTYQASNLFSGLIAGSYSVKVKNTTSGCEVAYPSNPVVLVAPVCNRYPTITSSLTATVPENTPNTTVVYTVTATDPDAGQTKTFSFETGGADNAIFTIDPLTGEVKFITSPDFELPLDANGDNIYEIKVKVCDNGTPQYCDVKTVLITVTDVIECTTGPNLPVIVNVTRADPSVLSCPALDNGTLTVDATGANLSYSIDGGVTYQASNLFSGLIAGSYSVKVKNTTSGCEVAYPSNPVVLVAPVCNRYPTITSSLTATVPENTPNTTVVYTVTATDPDAGQTKTFSFETGGADNTKFTIDPLTGGVKFVTSPDFELPIDANGDNVYEIKVKVCDNGTPQYCDVKTVLITVTDVLECVAGTTAPVIVNVTREDPSVLSCPALNNGTINVTATGTNLAYSIDNGVTYQASFSFTGLVAGSYNVKVKNTVTGCEIAYPSNPVVLAAPTCNLYPTITSSLTATTPENVSPSTTVYTVTSTDPNVGQTATYSFETGGADNAKFTIDPLTGAVKFIASPDFEVPTDANGDNVYEIKVKVCDNGTPQYCDVKTVLITVTDIDECVGFTAPIVAVNQPNCTTATGTITITSPTTGVTYSFDNGITFQASNVLSNVAAGVYQIVIKNSIGCKTLAKDYTIHPAPTVGCNCNNSTGTLTTTVSSQNTGVDYTQKYVLTDNAGVVAQIANTPSFTGLASATYAIYAVNYKTTEGVNGLTVGQNIAGANSPCLDVSKPLFYTVCIPVFICNNVSGNITAVISGQNTGAAFTQSYALTDENGVILKLSTTPAFTGLVNGKYKFYGVNYETAVGIAGLTVGQNISALTGGCLNVSEPLLFQVCQVPEICNNRIDDDGDGLIDCEDVTDCTSCGCDNTTGVITFTNTGQSTTAGYTQVYVLTDSTGKILNTNTAATFTVVTTGRYRVYAINYRTADGITGITVGGNISGVTGPCFDKSLPLLFKVCLCVTMNVKVMLEGPYQTATSDMQTILNQRGLLPGQTPIGQFAVATPAGQPYNVAPWNYLGTEGATLTTYPATVVDWVLLSLRSDVTVSSTVFRVTGLLHSDGHISFLSPCFDIANGSYYVVIEHRNHVGVMSPNKVPITNGVLTHDFTVNDSYVIINPPSFGQKQKGSKWVMYAGDGKKDTQNTNFDVNFQDSQYWKLQSGIFDQYRNGDFNMDADVNFADSYMWKFNSGKYSAVPH